MKDDKLTLEQIDDMKHCIGFNLNNPPKRNVLKSFRNYYATNESGQANLDELVNIGFMKKSNFHEQCCVYRVTKLGIDYLEKLFHIKIKQDAEDVI